MTARYALSPLYAVRLAGVAFDVLERLGTPAVSSAARLVNTRADAIDAAAEAALARLAIELPDDGRARQKIARRLSRRSALPAEIAHPWLAPYVAAHAQHAAARAALEAMIDPHYAALLAVIAHEARRELPDFLVFEAPSLVDEVRALEDSTRSAGKERRLYRMLAMYLQRVCAKNDTFSRFGPSMWGTVVPGNGAGVQVREGIERRVELETWVVARLAAVIDRDPEVRAEVPPRLHPHGRLEPGAFVRLDEQREIALTEAEHALARTCDGQRIVHGEALADLASRGVIVWAFTPYARDTSPLASLVADVSGWREPVRQRWLATLQPLQALVARFAANDGLSARREILDELERLLDTIGVAERERTRTLYAAMNPINENCTVASTFSIGAEACDRLIADASPWFELWRDAAAYATERVYQHVVEIVASAPRRAGRLPYSSLLHAARTRNFDLDRDGGITAIARAAWADVQRQFSGRLAGRPEAPAWQLTADDCTFLRRAHELPPAGDIALPSLDLLLSAASAEDAAAGRFAWVLGEAHHPFVLLQHGTYWSCPDKAALRDVIHAVTGGAAMLSRDAGNGMPVHGNPESFLELGATAFVGAARPKPAWTFVRPGDAEVIVDEARHDLRLRSPAGDDLGSLIRTAAITTGMHPFFPFVRAPHEPRLYLGDVVVQRRSWYLTSHELVRTPGVSASFLAALERLRGDRDIPRWVYVRPHDTTAAHATRDKDAKPICIDLESLVSLDIFERRLRKYETMVLVEMLPAPLQLFLKGPGGRVVFEIRTNVLERYVRRGG